MQRLSDLYHSYFGALPESISPLSGSASNRNYFRLTSSSGSAVGVIGLDPKENMAFICLSEHFRSKGIKVPEVYSVTEDKLCYIQQDLGDDMLSDRVEKARCGGWKTDPYLEELLCRTMESLADIQFVGTQGLDFSICYPQPSFDRRMVMFDLNYFKYCFLKPAGLEFDEILLQDDFERLADRLLEADSDTFLYRDFNARNVMLVDDVPYFIDFQGGRKGPVYYDVASFVWQARAGYPQDLKEKMLGAYLSSLAGRRDIPRETFDVNLSFFILFRLLQVLGAYGFRGWLEHKSKFIVSIPSALASLRETLTDGFDEFPYLKDTLRRMMQLPRFAEMQQPDGILEVKVQSFSYKKGIPEDSSGNGGGYVFDCRSIHNPGRYEPYKKLTGRDVEVIEFLEDDGEILAFLDHVYALVDPHVDTYVSRGFSNLMVSFGCTGGQHRSVYCAEHLARHLVEKYPQVRVRLLHREQNISEVFNPVIDE